MLPYTDFLATLRLSQLLLHAVKLDATDVAELFQWIVAVGGPIFDLLHCQVGLVVCVQNELYDLLGGLQNPLRRTKADAALQRIDGY